MYLTFSAQCFLFQNSVRRPDFCLFWKQILRQEKFICDKFQEVSTSAQQSWCQYTLLWNCRRLWDVILKKDFYKLHLFIAATSIWSCFFPQLKLMFSAFPQYRKFLTTLLNFLIIGLERYYSRLDRWLPSAQLTQACSLALHKITWTPSDVILSMEPKKNCL